MKIIPCITAVAIALLSISTGKLAIAQGKSNDFTETTASSNEYGEGGSEVTISDKHFKVLRRLFYDKCGRLRQVDLSNPHETAYHSPNGDGMISVTKDGAASYTELGPYAKPAPHKLHPDYAKELINEWKLTPCDKTDVAHGPPEKPKDHPNPLGEILQGVSIGIGGGRTVSHDDHKGDHRVTDHKRTSSTTKKLPAGCKCHPCTCSPCTCH